MIDHVSIAVSDLQRSAAFYRAILEPLGLTCLVERLHTIGFGKKYPEFWLNARRTMASAPDDVGAHICLRAPDRAAVEAFHRTALLCGGRDDGTPSDRDGEMTVYFGAFIRDPDGNKIEAVTFQK